MRRFLLPFALLLSASLAAQVPTDGPTDGLVAWYPFNGNANDESVFGNDGTVVGATLTTDRFGSANSAYNFDGNDHIEAAHQEWLNTGTGSKTWAGWGRKTSGNDHAHFLTKIDVTSSPYSAKNMYLRYAPNEGIEFSEGQSGQGNGVAIQSNSLLNQWVHLTGIKDANSGTTRIYQNGVLMGEATMQNPQLSFDNSEPLFIGCEHPYVSLPSGPQYFYGDLDDLGIWNRALSETEVTALFTGMAPVPGCTDETACNYQTEANVDDGSCVPSGCMEEGACNYNAAAECEGEACDYSCCPGPGCCGAGTHWDTILATCVVDVPDTVDEACTLMNLQELASGYAALVEQNAALDSLLAACEGDGAANASGPCAGQNHVTYHGHDYAIVEIGDQCWFAENLQTEAYNNGEPLQSDLNSGAWSTTNEGSYSIYNDEETNSINLGFLFNWHAVADGRGLCPLGWSVANEDAWIALEEYIESNLQADEIGLHLKSTESWTNGNGIDTYGFAAKAAGYRSNDSGEYNYIGNYTYFWSSTPSSSNSAFVRRLDYFSDNLTKYNGNDNLNQGFSVRCVKD
jgi:uncharacterized protein (TIGR02145 family)